MIPDTIPGSDFETETPSIRFPGAFLDSRERAEVELDFHYQLATFHRLTMLVCHCHSLTDRDIRRAVRSSGACSVAEVGDHCGAATGCGGCHDAVAQIVACEKRRLAVFGETDAPSATKPGLEQAQPEHGLALTG
jgi:bacterioferritin-associated ferredoxin